MKKLRELFEKYREIIAYLFWGVMTTVVSWVTFYLFSRLFASAEWSLWPWLQKLFGEDVTGGLALANILSWVCAVAFAFVTNKIRVFDSRSWAPSVVLPEALKFFGSRLATGVVEWVGVPLLVALGMNQALFGAAGMLAKILVSIVVIILNYVLSKLLVFRKKKAGS